jgi:hypothetical protein
MMKGVRKIKSLPPVSPTKRGYEIYFSRLLAACFQSVLKVALEPVKCTPAIYLELNTTSPITLPGTGKEVDHAVRHTCLLKDLHQIVVG